MYFKILKSLIKRYIFYKTKKNKMIIIMFFGERI